MIKDVLGILHNLRDLSAGANISIEQRHAFNDVILIHTVGDERRSRLGLQNSWVVRKTGEIAECRGQSYSEVLHLWSQLKNFSPATNWYFISMSISSLVKWNHKNSCVIRL